MKSKKKTIESTKSSLKFTPIAKEYSSEYDILKDPTGKLYTNGAFEDFYDLTVDKFKHLKNLIRKKPNALSATNINNIFRNTQNQYISVIGMVNEIRQTKKGNYFIFYETRWQGEKDNIHPISKEEAKQEFEGLREIKIEFEEAFNEKPEIA